MKSIIKVLSDHTINQIAAGEVIENPSSVVKELVENALDAKASHIVVEIKAGGQQLIRVSDDGFGMSSSDALLCLERHATSKISEAKDLFFLDTMGFRGEALASIAAISQLTLLTAQEDGVGTRVEVEGGKVIRVEPCARKRGTTIEVRSLFFNVPARRKFQKSVPVSSAEVTKLLTTLSLAHPQVAFELYQNDKISLEAHRTDGDFDKQLFSRVDASLGEEFLTEGYKVTLLDPLCHLSGVIGSPLNTRPNRSGQYLFINRRPVSCPLISYAVRDGYGTRLDSSRHPIYVLHVNLPADLIDVNVHPQKKEVRLRDERMIRQKIQDAISLSLQSLPCDISHKREEFAFEVFQDNVLQDNGLQDKVFKDHGKDNIFQDKVGSLNSPPLQFKQANFEREEKQISFDIEEDIQAIGLFEQYLLLDAKMVPDFVKGGKEGIVLVDLLEASARVRFESFEKGDRKESQGLAIPVTVDLIEADAQLIKAYLQEIQACGIGIRPFGKRSFIIDALPTFMLEDEVKDAICQIAEELHTIRKGILEEQKKQVLNTIAKRFAVSQKKQFVLQGALKVFKELLRTTSPYLGLSGKPTMVHLSINEINQFFAKKK